MLTALVVAGLALAAPPESVELFNGKDLTGWEGHSHIWRVDNGEIVGAYPQPTEPNTFLLTKRTDFRNFRLICQGKLVKSEIHTAISIWGEKADPAVAKDPFAYKGYLVIFPAPWGINEKFGRGAFKIDLKKSKEAGKPHDWNDLEILAVSPRVRVAINGVLAIDWTDPKPELLKTGPIGLELHGGKVSQEVRFRKFTLELNPADDRLLTVK